MSDFVDFRLILCNWRPQEFDPLSGSYNIIVVTETGEPESLCEVSINWGVIRSLLASFKGKKISSENAEKLRRLLAKLLLPDKISVALRQAEAVAKERNQLIRIRLDILDDRLTAIPWEFAQINDSYCLGFDPGYSIVRHSRSLQSWSSARYTNPKIRALFISADKIIGYDELNTDDHVISLGQQLMGGTTEIQDTDIQIITGATPNALFLALEKQWDIIHFAGHGVISESGPRLVLHDNNNTSLSVMIAVEDVLPKMIMSGVRLVNLFACHSGQSVINGQTNGIAGALSKHGIPAVLSMQDTIQPQDAYAQSITIYRHLIAGADLERAIILGRLSNIKKNEPNYDWAIPILHLQDIRKPFFIKRDVRYESRIINKFREVLLKDNATLIELQSHFQNDIEVAIDQLTLTGNSVGVKL